jgi:hypothetical protein
MTAPFDAEAYAREAARLIGLPLAAEHLPGVARNLALAAAQAALLSEAETAEEPAPVFRPGAA